MDLVGALLDTVLQIAPSSGASCIILGSCRLPKNCLSKAALPGRVAMVKAPFMVKEEEEE